MGGGAIDTFMKLKSSFKKQCKNRGSKLVIKKAEYGYPHQLRSIQIAVEDLTKNCLQQGISDL